VACEEQFDIDQLFGIPPRTRLEDGGGDKPTSSQWQSHSSISASGSAKESQRAARAGRSRVALLDSHYTGSET